jgi:hypothetical protein
MTTTSDLLIGRLPALIQEYLDTVARGDNLTGVAERERAICQVFEWLLGLWVSEVPMFDGVSPRQVSVSDAGIVEVCGLVFWDRGNRCFRDPFAAWIELSSSRRSVTAWGLSFGDAATGLGKFEYPGSSKDLYRPLPVTWLYTFGNERRR